jgi:hypothetical protein
MSTQTIEFLLHKDHAFAAWNGFLFDRIVGVKLEGVRIGDLPSDLGLSETLPRVRQQKTVEVIAIANVLVACGNDGSNIHLRERPDAEVTLLNDRMMTIEHTEGRPGCQRDSANLVQYWTLDAIAKDASIQQALGNLTILLDLHHTATRVGWLETLTQDCPGDHVGKSDAQNMKGEILGLIAKGYCAKLARSTKVTIAPSDGKTLAKYHATVMVGERVQADQLPLQISSSRFLPGRTSLSYVMKNRLAEKAAVVKQYEDKTDWLVVDIKQTGGDEFDFDLAENPVEEIAPFSKVALIVWRNWQPFVATWTMEEGKVVSDIPHLPDEDHGRTEQHDWFEDWVRGVDVALDSYRTKSMLRGENPMRVPHLSMGPGTAQWYQYWMGPHPWVTCDMVAGRTDIVLASFWINGDWNGRRRVEHRTDDAAGFALAIWDFLKPAPGVRGLDRKAALE